MAAAAPLVADRTLSGEGSELRETGRVVFRTGEPESLAATEEEALCSFACAETGAGGEKQWLLANLGE